MKKFLMLITVVSAVATSALAQSGQIGERQWKLVQLNGVNASNSLAAYLELDADQTRFTGNSGCNRMFGAVSVRRDRVDFSNIGTTKMACADRRAQRAESDFVRALENANRFERRGNLLELYVRRRLVMKFTALTKQPPQDTADDVRLENRKWMLEATKGVPVSKLGRTAFVVFDKDKGSAGGNTSCNVFGGSYSAVGRTLKLTDVISTMRACIEDERMKIEREFLDGLEKANRYEIQREKLMLYQNNRLLLTFNGEAK
ncbi:MAG: META domain-containing protein [Acidobacteriota bacterium]